MQWETLSDYFKFGFLPFLSEGEEYVVIFAWSAANGVWHHLYSFKAADAKKIIIALKKAGFRVEELPEHPDWPTGL